ncbi:Desmoglein-2 [Nibea albiflora]|uniref:Desmoglein-2 n=1 Tax=Nibea albiflora TaxID=240163 RepID=A0ACB7EM01_NIBAL|nr:Desmoglein-2 [Nibea albiflora]
MIRKRSQWVIPPKELNENENYTHLESISKIRSDFETKHDIEYSLEGIGANRPPFHVFVVDSRSGLIRVTKILDREEIAMYNLSGIAKQDGTEVERKIDLRIKVMDKNDNTPKFSSKEVGNVKELSAIDTSVMKITATDADEPGNDNSRIAYFIKEQNPPHNMFYLHRDGTVYVQDKALDRETADQYTLTVEGKDLDGRPGGNTGTGTVVINILDENDNLPTLEKDQYEVSIDENTQGVEVMRFQAHDLDLEGTDNWKAIFDIVKGNEAGYFSFKVDEKTNVGILMLDKALDYEEVKSLELGVALRNKAAAYSAAGSTAAHSAAAGSTAAHSAAAGYAAMSGAGYKIYGITVNVKNQPEGPIFDPKVKSIHVSEGDKNITIKKVIAKYPAMDGDTRQEAENVRYVKALDPGNWLTIDPKTAEIKLNKMPDRESSFLEDGTYFAKVLCISQDMPDTTATGTIAIQVKDSNDHCPTLTSDSQTMCTTSNSIIVNATDEDLSPNGPPFHYEIIPEGNEGKWKVEHIQDTARTAAILRAKEYMWPGYYEVEFHVMDQQKHHCKEPQKVKIEVCTCEDGVTCGKAGTNRASNGAVFGPAGIGLLFLGLLLLLLFLLMLIYCNCGVFAKPVFTALPFDPIPHLINYHTEGQGENTTDHLLTSLYTDWMNGTSRKDDFLSSQRGSAFGFNQDYSSDFCSTFRSNTSGFGGGLYDGMSLPDHFLREYYTQKIASENEKIEMADNLLVYDFEGQGSSAGSVGCCSLLEFDNNLQFLDDVGLKFKALAEVCGGNKISAGVKQVLTPLPSTSINTQSSVSSVGTAQQRQLTVPKTEQTVIRETSQHSQMVKDSTVTVKEGMTTINKGMTNQGQMLLLQQQPVYYTTSPMLQPMQYVVQPQAHNTMVLAEAQATNLQGMVLVNGTETGTAQAVFEGSSANLIHTGNLTGSQTMVVVEGGIPAGSLKVMKGNQTRIVQGCTISNGGRLIQEAGGLSPKSDISGSQRVLYSNSHTSTGS